MSINRAVPGEAISVPVNFTDEEGDPIFDIVEPVKYAVFSPDGRKVVSGNAIVDPVDSSLYVVSFTLPANIPLSLNGDKAKLVVVGKDSDGMQYQHRDWFEILPTGDDAAASKNRNVVVPVNTAFSTTFTLPAEYDPDSVVFTLYQDNGSAMTTLTPTPTIVGGNKIWKANFPANNGFNPSLSTMGAYLGQWVATGGNLPETEVETVSVYILNPSAMLLMEQMRSMLDKGYLQNIHPYLSWGAEAYIQNLHKGFEYVNGAGGSITAFSLGGPLPVGLTGFIEKAATVAALRAQLLAEAQSNFDFQGLGVQLTVDRTAALNDLIAQLQGDLDKLPEAKKAWKDTGGPTGPIIPGAFGSSPVASGIVISEATNYAQLNVWDNGIAPYGRGGASNYRGRRGGSTRL